MKRKRAEGKKMPQLDKLPVCDGVEELLIECYLLFGIGPSDILSFCYFYNINDRATQYEIFLHMRAIHGKLTQLHRSKVKKR